MYLSDNAPFKRPSGSYVAPLANTTLFGALPKGIYMSNTANQIDHQDEIKVYISDNGYLCIEQESSECGGKVTHTISKNNIKDFIALCNFVFNKYEDCNDA